MKAGSVSVVLGCAEGWGTELGALRGVMGCCELLRLCWWGGQRACCASSLLAVWTPQNTKQADPREGAWDPRAVGEPPEAGCPACRWVPPRARLVHQAEGCRQRGLAAEPHKYQGVGSIPVSRGGDPGVGCPRLLSLPWVSSMPRVSSASGQRGQQRSLPRAASVGKHSGLLLEGKAKKK